MYDDGKLLIIPRQNIKLKKMPVTIPLTGRAARVIRSHSEASASNYVFVRQDWTPYNFGSRSAQALSVVLVGLN